MKLTTKAVLMFAVLSMSSIATAEAYAQDPASGAPAASSAKQTRAQRKAERKARRAQKNAQLKQLEDQGFQPGGTRIDGPQTLPQKAGGSQAPAGN